MSIQFKDKNYFFNSSFFFPFSLLPFFAFSISYFVLLSISHSLFLLVFFSFNINFILRLFIYLFLETGEGREKERERSINVWFPLTWSPLRTWPATQACALTGNRTGDPLVRAHAQPTELHQPGLTYTLKRKDTPAREKQQQT